MRCPNPVVVGSQSHELPGFHPVALRGIAQSILSVDRVTPALHQGSMARGTIGRPLGQNLLDAGLASKAQMSSLTFPVASTLR
jgi:hypothetical protein